MGSGLWTKGEQAAQPLLSLRERRREDRRTECGSCRRTVTWSPRLACGPGAGAEPARGAVSLLVFPFAGGDLASVFLLLRGRQSRIKTCSGTSLPGQLSWRSPLRESDTHPKMPEDSGQEPHERNRWQRCPCAGDTPAPRRVCSLEAQARGPQQASPVNSLQS